ncbi:MAG: septal ring lytic transglycosylase RlpA family protein [Chitinophagia bacterium]|jgi:rare lipoprotein A (peptidoglycan hydrolase)|nr:septal ring lytic transglycosylase RlpA family protein [Chitinophagia bacterium]NCA30430.1 septal ring lytic transglycosylase RlpA family protein [Chitinophagia bacterium]
MNIKLSFIFILVFPLINITQVFAQKIYPTSLTTINYLDSAALKKYHKKIDTHRIKIELNHITGIASFYSANLDGTMTSTGEIFKNSKYTAACNLYKLNTLVRVTNMRNGRSILVRVNDRMHPNMLKLGRVIDLSSIAAKKLHLNSKGIVKVALDAVGYSKINPKKQ